MFKISEFYKSYISPPGDTILDDLPRIPFTYNPGGRKYLRDLEVLKNQQKSIEGSNKTLERERILKTKPKTKSYISHADASDRSTSQKISLDVHQVDSSNLLSQLDKLEQLVKRCIHDPTSGEMTCKIIRKDLGKLDPEIEEHVFSQAEVGVQCSISQG